MYWDVVWDILSKDFLKSTIRLSVTPVAAAMGELYSERAGIINIGLEGMILAGAFGAVLGSYYTGNSWVGLVVAMAVGCVVALSHGFLTVSLVGDQVVSGIMINVGVLGITTFLSRAIFGSTSRPEVSGFPNLKVPGLCNIPFVGEVLFTQSVLVYITFGAVLFTWFVVHKTYWGRVLIAVGEHPAAADSVGINVYLVRYAVLGFCGLLTGLAGAYLSLGQLNMFLEGMSGGKGFIALAIVVAGKREPILIALIGLLFGAMETMALRFQVGSIKVAYQLLLGLPYVFTLVAYVCFVRGGKDPACLGKPYIKE